MRVESFIISGWEDYETGLVISENDEWILVKHIPVDFVVDGYKVYKKTFVEERVRGDDEILIEKVLKLKGVKEDAPADFVFGNTQSLLEWSQKKYGLFEFQDCEESEMIYGRINHIEDRFLTIDFIGPRGKVEVAYDYRFDFDGIGVITFETDYFNSIKLLWEDERKR